MPLLAIYLTIVIWHSIVEWIDLDWFRTFSLLPLDQYWDWGLASYLTCWTFSFDYCFVRKLWTIIHVDYQQWNLISIAYQQQNLISIGHQQQNLIFIGHQRQTHFSVEHQQWNLISAEQQTKFSAIQDVLQYFIFSSNLCSIVLVNSKTCSCYSKILA